MWGLTLTFAYDDADLLSVTDSKGGVIVNEYNDNHLLEKRTFDDGTNEVALVYGYTDRDELEDISRYSDVLTTTLKAVRMNTLADRLIFCRYKGTPTVPSAHSYWLSARLG